MAENEALTTAVQRLAWDLARQQPTGHHAMEADSPWEPGLSQQQRRSAWLATLSALTAIQAEAARLAEAAETQAVEFGAGDEDLARAAGALRRRRRSRFTALFSPARRRGLDDLGTLSAHGRAMSDRIDNPPQA